MNNIYVVTEGPDNCIIAIFDNRDLADEFVMLTLRGTVEEHQVNKYVPCMREKGAKYYEFYMLRGGEVHDSVALDIDETVVLNVTKTHMHLMPAHMDPYFRFVARASYLSCKVLADSPEHAVEIANQRRLNMIATGEWLTDKVERE